MSSDNKLRAVARFQEFYLSANRKGSARLLRGFLGESVEFPIALSVAHGVDFGQCFTVQDIDNPEPIHWCCNPEMFNRAEKVKPALMAPHPWAILARRAGARKGEGALVIGPPPGPANDSKLYELLKKNDLGNNVTILVKARSNYLDSMRFWNARGISAITAAARDEEFYERLYDLLSAYRHVIGVTFSSALVFAASIGKEVHVLRGYCYRFYDTGDYREKLNFYSDRSREIVKTFVNSDQENKKLLAKHLLGFQYLDDPSLIKDQYLMILTQLHAPYIFSRQSRAEDWLRVIIARVSGRKGILKRRIVDAALARGNKNISVVALCEIEAWLGDVEANIDVGTSRYIKGRVEPGFAVEQY